MELKFQQIKPYLFVASLSILFTLMLVYLFNNVKQNSPSTATITNSPTLDPQQEAAPSLVHVSNENKNLPLFAYIYDGNVYVKNLSTRLSQQITKNGSVTNLAWSKDGRWLYWSARYQENGQSRWSFAKAEYPKFNLEIFYITDSSQFDIKNDIYAFIPLTKHNQIVVASKNGLYLVGNFVNKTGKIIETIALNKPLEGMNDPNIKDSYAIQDIDPDESNLALSYCTWEGCPEVGYLNLKDKKFIPLPQTGDDPTGGIVFSTSGKFLMTFGGSNDMIGGNTQEVVYAFPSLKQVFRSKDIYSDAVGGAVFIDDTRIALAIGFDSGIGTTAPREGIAVVDFIQSKQLSYLPLILEKPNQDQPPQLSIFLSEDNNIYANYNFNRMLKVFHLNQSNIIENVIDFDYPVKDGNYSIQPKLPFLK